jgi:hypothetical protein
MSTHTLPRSSSNIDQDAFTLAQHHDTNARWYLDLLMDGMKPANRPDFGRWEPLIALLEEVYVSGNGNAAQIVTSVLSDIRTNNAQTNNYPGLEAMLTGNEVPPTSPQPPALQESSNTEDSEYFVPPLPLHVKANEARASEASPILDALINYFRYWCTRSYEGYHEAVAIWVLATIAARRVVLKWRNGFWTTLYIMLVSISGRHAKTEATSYGTKVIRECGLDFSLVPDETTPQRLLSRMSKSYIPRNYADMDSEQKEKLELKLAFAAQKGWSYDEFGDFLQEVMQGKGANAHFYRLLKQFYDNKPEFTYDTLTRGEEHIDLPSLCILGTTAPDSLKSIAGRESKIWKDGTVARISWVVPPADSLQLRSAPDGEATVPEDIRRALIEWHERLGIPKCEIVDLQEREELLEQTFGKDDKKKKKYDGPQYKINCEPLPQNEIDWRGTGVREAHQAYFQALVQIGLDYNLDARLNSSYIRLPDMALKIAMLLASLENHNRLDMRHWSRGQAITERWRRDLHQLLIQLSSGSSNSLGEIEDRVLEAIAKIGKMVNARTISQQSTFLRSVGVQKVRDACEELAAAKVIAKEGAGRGALFGPLEAEQKGW